MKIEQIYTGCLAQGAYYIESNGEAIIIDPLREVSSYLEKAEKDKSKIKYIFETHFHADFVSGHLELASKSGATIVYGPNANPEFNVHIAEDGEVFEIGEISLIAIHTPGHTMESTCFLLKDAEGKDKAIFTGDTLFIGDVGRPDLAQKVSDDLSQDKLAGYLFDSLRNKLMPLADDVIVYPAHGAGSACGKNMSKETFDTLGNQKKTNYALNLDLTKEQFIKQVLDGLQAPPAYFPQNVMLNIKGYEGLDGILEKGTTALSPKEFETLANQTHALILDTRHQEDFKRGFVPNSIFIGIDGGFAPWVGALVPDIKQKILIIADEGREEEVVIRLARVGFDNALGFLKGGIAAWKENGFEVDLMESVSPSEFYDLFQLDNKVNVLDVRKESEYKAQHKDGENVLLTPLEKLNDELPKLKRDKKFYIHCKGGYRSVIAASILKSRGFDNLIDIKEGFEGIEKTKVPTSAFVCPSALK